jgi:hypothetical protein
MKETKRNETKRRREARQAEKTEQLLHKVKRVIDGGTELHRLNGIWYVIEIKDVPPPRIEYQMPYGWNIADRIRWRNMTDAERVEHGTRREVHDHHPMSLESDDGEAYKYIDHQRFKYSHGWNATLFKKYYASKVTASAKILKEHGLVGTALHDDDVGVLSHRERSKYRE